MASTSTNGTKHDVFLSFRGRDTRKNFTGHLLSAMSRNCIDAFVDEAIGGGEGNSDTLLNKISEALVSVVIFSQNYAASQYCLDELVKIVECEQSMGLTVLPVFLGVEPTHVRKQTGALGDGFDRLVRDGKFKDKEETWRRALVEVANLSGWDSKEKFGANLDFYVFNQMMGLIVLARKAKILCVARSQDKIVEEIVNCIEKKLDQIVLQDQYDWFVGISRVETVESMLRIGSSERTRSIGVWGMGGIGKSTIAKLVLDRLPSRFEGACFVANVRARSERDGLDCVQKDMILQLLGVVQSSSAEYIGPYILSPVIRRRLKRKRVLVVLDDVDSPRQLHALLGHVNFYGPGSRILVTSRNKQVLVNGCNDIYEVQKLNQREALQLFKLHAFKEDEPAERLIELSKKAITYANGLPLALEVLGCNLHGRDTTEWETELAKLEEIPDVEIADILRISYDGLDEKEKNIFLDIACLFQGWETNRVERILDGCGFYAGIGISRLLDKALISISNNDIAMHDLVQQMGQNIVLQECVEDPSNRSRLWRIKDIHDVLSRNKGSEQIEVISFDLSNATRMELRPTVFNNMTRLRVLHFQNYTWSLDIKVHLPKGLEVIPNQLRYFRWDAYPFPSLATNFLPEHLVELRMAGSHLTQLWSGDVEPFLPKLKHVDLAFSRNLIKLPNLSKASSLETLELQFCQDLEEVSSIENLVMLKSIKLGGNKKLLTFPDCPRLTGLETLHLYGCSKITKVPVLPENIISLNLSSTAIRELPSAVGYLHRLRELLLAECPELESISSSICELEHLEELELVGCPNLLSLPQNLGDLKSLMVLNLDGTGITSLPDSICNLSSLDKLTVRRCWYLHKLPENLSDLGRLQTLVTDRSPIESLPSSIYHLTSLQHLSCRGYKGNLLPSFTGSPNVGGNSSKFVGLMALEELHLLRSDLKTLPESIKYLPKLKELHLSDCKHLGFLPELPSSLECLDATNCLSLENALSFFRKDDEKLPPSFEFQFVNCCNLEGKARNRIVRDFWLRIQATVAHRLPQEPSEDKPYEHITAHLHISGSDVPEWFEYSGKGSILQLNKNTSGRLDGGQLAFCAVVGVPVNYEPMDFDVKCKCLTESGDHFISSCKYTFPEGDEFVDEEAMILKSEHLFLWYDEREFENSSYSFSEAIFEFYVVGSYDEGEMKGHEIVKCGVSSVRTTFGTRARRSPIVEDGNDQDEEEGSDHFKRSEKRRRNQGNEEEEILGCLYNDMSNSADEERPSTDRRLREDVKCFSQLEGLLQQLATSFSSCLNILFHHRLQHRTHT